MKRLLSLALALMGTLVILAGCTVYAEKQERNSREWIEGKLSALDKVYPTENLYDLFDKFPDGFTIKVGDTFENDGESYSRRIKLLGNPEDKTITGNVSLVQLEKKELEPVVETIIDSSDLVYSESEGLSLVNDTANDELLPYHTFLFQKLTLNKKVLSSYKLVEKSYNWQSEQAWIKYELKNKVVNDFLFLPKDKTVDLMIVGKSLFLKGKEFGIPVTFQISQQEWHSEIVKDSIEEEEDE